MAGRSNEERVGHNEGIFREINERAEEIGTALDRPTEFLCEWTRARARHFLVLPGHEQLEYERVVDQGNGWLVVTKIGVAGEVADDEDPRTG